MQNIPLESRPNQAFTLVLNSRTYRIRIADMTDGLMVTDVSVNTIPVATGVRALHADFILPYPGMEDGNGNFMWFDDQGRQPTWENFGSTCFLYYVSQDEIAAAYATQNVEAGYRRV